ncbi:MAG: hypothetical protein VW338_08935 [Rhodospirillaceae bacterium]
MLERSIRDLIGEQKVLKMYGEDSVVDAARSWRHLANRAGPS